MTDVFEALSQKDIDSITDIREYFSETDTLKLNTVDWLRYWRREKNLYLSGLFDDSLILSKPITYCASEEELAERIKEEIFNHFSHLSFDGKPMTDIQRAGIKWRDKFYDVFYYQTHSFDEKSILSQLIDSLALGTNLYTGQNGSITVPSTNKQIKIHNGCKVSKIIGQLCQEAGFYDLWEPVRLKISQIRNTSKLSGMLHLSIHPIDFMTSSDNDYDWSSCMKFGNGDYCRGVIEMMNSPIVVQAYLTGQKETFDFRPDVEWYNKKWREFFLVTPTMISGVKGYPYWNQDLERATIGWIYSLVREHDDLISAQDTWTPIIEFKLGEDIPAIGGRFPYIYCGPAMYNDFYGGETYQATFSSCFNRTEDIDYSGFSECLNCGDDAENADAFSLVCNGCSNYITCAHCEERLHVNNAYYAFGEYYCEDCYNDLNFCANCNQPVDDDYALHLIYTTDEQKPRISPYEAICLCSSCTSDIMKPNTKIHRFQSETSFHGYRRWYDGIFINDIKEDYIDNEHPYPMIKLGYETYDIDPDEYKVEVEVCDNN